MFHVFLVVILLAPVASTATSDSSQSLINPDWVTYWGGEYSESGRGVVVAGNYIYVCGYVVSPDYQVEKVFLLKYDMGGGLQWNETWDNPVAWPNDLAVSGDAVYVTGCTDNSTMSTYKRDLFLLKFGLDGKLLWSRAWDGTGWESICIDEGNAVRVIDGYVYIVGTTTPYDEAAHVGRQDAVVLKYDPDGNLVWEGNLGRARARSDLTFEYGNCMEVGQ
jgi:hypothetical protein